MEAVRRFSRPVAAQGQRTVRRRTDQCDRFDGFRLQGQQAVIFQQDQRFAGGIQGQVPMGGAADRFLRRGHVRPAGIFKQPKLEFELQNPPRRFVDIRFRQAPGPDGLQAALIKFRRCHAHVVAGGDSDGGGIGQIVADPLQ